MKENAIQIVKDLPKTFSKQDYSRIEKAIEKGTKPIGYWAKTPYYFLVNENNNLGYTFLYDPDTKTIHYMMTLSSPKSLGVKAGRQVWVQRNRDDGYKAVATGFARHIFFDIFLNKYRTMFSDTKQTEEGKRFWFNAVVTSLEKGYYCFTFQGRVKGQETFQPIKDLFDLSEQESGIWGHATSDQKVFLVISKYNLNGSVKTPYQLVSKP